MPTEDQSNPRPMKRTARSLAESRDNEHTITHWPDDPSLETVNGRPNRDRTDLSDVPADDCQIRRVRWGDTVQVAFMAWLEDGTLIHSSIHSEPPTFTAGSHSIIEGIERLVIGMSVGESKTEKIPPDSAFGPYHPELSCRVSHRWFQAYKIEPQVGLGLEVRKTDGTMAPMIITGVDGDRVTLDANHLLAGKGLLVQLDLLDILDQVGSGAHATPTMKPRWKRQPR